MVEDFSQLIGENANFVVVPVKRDVASATDAVVYKKV